LSEFSSLSATLSFSVPAEARTSLANLLTADPSQTDSFPSNTGFSFNTGAFSTDSASEVVVTRTAARSTTTGSSTQSSASAAATPTPGAGVHSAQVGYMALVGALVVVPGFLMVWL
jgi:cobalamin biosynthesis Mg chelatase CobN